MKTPTISVESCKTLYGTADVKVGGDADLDTREIRLCAYEMDFREIVDTLIHENLHLVLVEIGEREASHAIDNTWDDYHNV